MQIGSVACYELGLVFVSSVAQRSAHAFKRIRLSENCGSECKNIQLLHFIHYLLVLHDTKISTLIRYLN